MPSTPLVSVCTELSIEEVSATDIAYNGSSTVPTVITVTAPTGKKFISGGFKIEQIPNPANSADRVHVVSSYASDSFTKWNVGVINVSGIHLNVTVIGYAVSTD